MKMLLKGLKTFFLICLSIPFILILLFMLLTIGVTIVNDINASNHQKDFCKVELPQDTSIVDNEYSIGHFDGNGNGTRYYLSMVIQSNLSLDELKEYYKNFNKYIEIQHFNDDTKTNFQFSYDKLTEYPEDYYLILSIKEPNNLLLYELDLRGH